MKTFVCIASPNEIKLVEKYLSRDQYDFVIITGVGAVNVIRALDNLPRNFNVINIGYAGSVDLPIGTMAQVSQVSMLRTECDYIEPIAVLHGEIPCYTSSDFVVKSDKTGCVFDMELATIAALGFASVRSIKEVSDNLNYNQYNSSTND